LLGSAYDAPEIHDSSHLLEHIPIINHNKRKGEKREFEPAQKLRYK